MYKYKGMGTNVYFGITGKRHDFKSSAPTLPIQVNASPWQAFPSKAPGCLQSHFGSLS